MGYTTEFEGQITITPPLSPEEINYLNAFANTRHMHRKNGPYFVDDNSTNAPDILDINAPDPSQPGLWCKWVPTDDGTALEWNGFEKFYEATKWMAYLIEHFLKPDAKAAGQIPGINGGHTMKGLIYAKGEEPGDIWYLAVNENVVTEADGKPSAHVRMEHITT